MASGESTVSDRTWTPILRPGVHDDYFSAIDASAIEQITAEFDGRAARLLAELSHWVYRRSLETDEDPIEPVAADALARAGFEELAFLADGPAECVVIRPIDSSTTVVVFKGSSRLSDWLANVDARTTTLDGDRKVHSGFHNALMNIWPQLQPWLTSTETLLLAGHSLGAAMATIAAALHPPTAVYTIGSPRVGNEAFVHSLADVPIHRIVNNADAVTRIPPATGPLFHYQHAGQALHLSPTTDPTSDQVAENVLQKLGDAVRRSVEPPDDLWDHAPINYIRRLAELV
jgi:triacylglycerol lipase